MALPVATADLHSRPFVLLSKWCLLGLTKGQGDEKDATVVAHSRCQLHSVVRTKQNDKLDSPLEVDSAVNVGAVEVVGLHRLDFE